MLGLAMLLASAFPAAAQAPDIISRLQQEPVTLFDWGIAQLDRDMTRAAARIVPARLSRLTAPANAGVLYNGRERRITLYISASPGSALRTRGNCASLFADVVDDLTAGAPSGPDAAGWYLHNAFRPKAHFWGSPFEDVGAKLLDRVSLEITLQPPPQDAAAGDSSSVRCSGRLDAGPRDLVMVPPS